MTSRAQDTRARLRAAALAVVREKGVGGASARTIAAAAGVNQALIFYHFASVSELIEAASDEAVAARVALYREAFTDVASLSDLLAIARRVHDQERQAGSMTVMAQIMAGAQTDPVLARAARHALASWTDEVDQVLRRVLATSPVGPAIDGAGLAQLVSAAFVGIELYHGADPEAADLAFSTLERLNHLVAAIEDLGPTAQRAIRLAGSRVSRKPTPRAPASERVGYRPPGPAD
ncbi:MAG: TetR family transcriptional regulator [Propionicimonas sp.]|uniref:TetR family transcriptional regulator n=1 Tax=Propionicimonas sp. TaxID=1955623 RepID=UPI002B21473D|nr:TetR family transcriptional regulator [Propionicimonas sp.]MEA4944278.1 TetR family transcriptional regulator [Propionicimonas sp.]MEA5052909.1 TetR family transcriptional regulator [Propionicimonas sp.]MEA5119047.1 TetR family transcriptional regulator [Propionicimonas sp.]